MASSSSIGENFKKLRETFLNRVIFSQDGVLGVNASDRLADILGVMSKRNVTSVPVFDDQAKGEGKGEKIIGIIDVYSIVRFASIEPFLNSPMRQSKDPDHFHSVLETQKHLWEKTASDLMESVMLALPNVNVFEGMDPLGRVLDCFENDPRCHRVFCIADNLVSLEPGVRRLSVVSKSDIVRYVSSNREELVKDLLAKNAKELGLIKPKDWVVTVNSDTRAVEAFSAIANERLNAVAVVNPSSGQLLDCLSASDLRGTSSEGTSRLILPVTEFLSRPDDFTVVACDDRATFSQILDLFTQKSRRIHRVWVVDAEKRPVGVITVSDVVHLFKKK